MLYHGYAVRMVIGEKKSDDREGVYKELPEDRYKAALMSFYKAVRKQLRVADPEDIPPLDISPPDRELSLEGEGES